MVEYNNDSILSIENYVQKSNLDIYSTKSIDEHIKSYDDVYSQVRDFQIESEEINQVLSEHLDDAIEMENETYLPLLLKLKKEFFKTAVYMNDFISLKESSFMTNLRYLGYVDKLIEAKPDIDMVRDKVEYVINNNSNKLPHNNLEKLTELSKILINTSHSTRRAITASERIIEVNYKLFKFYYPNETLIDLL